MLVVSHLSHDPVAASWDREYAGGRYVGAPPVRFVDDIVEAAKKTHLLGTSGLYIGCGNGRNYVPLVDAGLDLIGLDVSEGAIETLARRVPDRASKLVHGDLNALPRHTSFHVVVGIQVFQHGSREACHAHIHAAQQRVAPSGMIAIRVNAVGTDIVHRHDLVETNDMGGFTVRYLEGPKAGLLVHFFDAVELRSLFSDGFEAILPIRLDVNEREPAERGQWSQWEGIWACSP